MRADLDRQLKFPVEITTTSLRPDIVLWSTSTKTVIMVELRWEEGMEAAFERKRDTELASECSQAGWKAFTCRGYTGASTQRLQAQKDLERPGRGGGTRELQAVAQKEGQAVGEARSLGLVVGGSRESCLAATSAP